MKKNTPLDYAEFLLTHSRSRCELHIYANGVKEKLASGYLKPFVTHLREAEAQVSKGNQVVRLERPSTFLKKNKVNWFTKGTLERFVRFVSTPEVLERVKNIDDELSQLEHVRIALAKTSVQSEDLIYSNDTSSSGVFQKRGDVSLKDKRLMGDNGDDSSKMELLKAMDVRILALKQEQRNAFSRAIAAGFDNSNMADLLDFSELFGADRLREACIQFIGLFRGRNIAQEIAGEECSSADATSSGSDMSLESCTDAELPADSGENLSVAVEEECTKAVRNVVTNLGGKLVMKEKSNILGSISSVRTRSRWGPPERLHINHVDPELQDFKIYRKEGDGKHHSGKYNHQDDIRASQAGEEFHTTIDLKDQLKVPSERTNCSILIQSGGNVLQETKQGGAISRPGMFFGELCKMAEHIEAGYLSDGALRPCKPENKGLPGQCSTVNNCSAVLEEPALARNSIIKSSVDYNACQFGDTDRKTNLGSANKSQLAEDESSKLKEKQVEPVSTSTRRLSVQAAISLFESKKLTVEEPPMRKPVRQDSQKAAVQNTISASEKSVLCRWSGVLNDGSDRKQINASDGVQKRQENVVVSDNAAQMVEVVSEGNSLRAGTPIQSTTCVGSTYSGQLDLQDSSVEASFSKQILSQHQQSVSSISTEVPVEIMPKQSNEEVPNVASFYPNIVQTSIVFPPKPLTHTLQCANVSTLAREAGHQDIIRAAVGTQEPVTQQTKVFKQSKMQRSLSIPETQTKQFLNNNEGKGTGHSSENLKIDGLKHKTGKSRLPESDSHVHIGSTADKKPSLILHDTPVDLYMQALVMMIDNHHQNTLSSDNEESLMEQRGRFYDRYSQLRNARQMGENPAKRADREAKLKLLQESLERRKAEMKAGVSRQMRNNYFVKDPEFSAASGKAMPIVRSTGGEMGEDKVQQDGLVLAPSHAHPVLKGNIQTASHVTPKEQLDVVASRSLLNSPAVQAGSSQKSESGTATLVNNQHKMASSCGSMTTDSSINRTLLDMDTTRNVGKSAATFSDFTGKFSEKMKRHPVPESANRDAFSVVESGIATDALPRIPDADLQLPPLEVVQERKNSNCATFVYAKSSCSAQSSILIMSQDSDSFSVSENDLGKKHEVSDIRNSLGSFNKQSHIISNGKSRETNVGSQTLEYSSFVKPENFRSNADKSPCLIQNPLVSLSLKSARHLAPDASTGKQASFANEVDEKKSKKNSHEDQMKILLNNFEEISSLTLAKKSTKLSQSSSICSPSIPHERSTSNFSDMTTSPMNYLEEASGGTRATRSPKLSPSPYGSPASWTYLKAKHSSEHERHSALPQSSKEPVRGFRRLLRFGRKKHTSESMSFDGVSVSTTSEGDDETEELRESMGRSPNELLRRVKSQEKGWHVNNIKDFTGLPYPREIHSLQSSISIPQSSFKQPDDYILGGPSLKASRSFFSLSGFRSRGGEGKFR